MLISEEYKEQNRALHEANQHYGTSGAKWRDMVRPLAQWGRKRILDYGCGKQTLSRSLGPAYNCTDFDPCIEGLDAHPSPHPVVVCGDVMEHIEPECIEDVLADIRSLTQEVALFVIHLGPAKKTLPDGRNAHLSQHPAEWWEDKLKQANFKVSHQDGNEYEAWFICEPEEIH